MRNKMGSELYFRSSRITSGWQSTPYCGQVRHSKKFGASSRGTVTNPDFLKNPGARATRKILLPPRFLVSAIPRSSRAFPSFSFRYSGSTAMPSTMNSPCLSCIPPNPHQAPAVHLRSPSSTERDPSAPRNLLRQGIPGRWLRKTVPAVRSRLSLRSNSSVFY